MRRCLPYLVSILMLSVPGTVAQFERDLIKERRSEDIGLAKQRSVYTGHKNALGAKKKTKHAVYSASAARFRTKVVSLI
jgi:DNA invertase Pin-like site-specific DNA recombinase